MGRHGASRGAKLSWLCLDVADRSLGVQVVSVPACGRTILNYPYRTTVNLGQNRGSRCRIGTNIIPEHSSALLIRSPDA
jgi:hypothetical protein